MSDIAKCSATLTSILGVHHLLRFVGRHEKVDIWNTSKRNAKKAMCNTARGVGCWVYAFVGLTKTFVSKISDQCGEGGALRAQGNPLRLPCTRTRTTPLKPGVSWSISRGGGAKKCRTGFWWAQATCICVHWHSPENVVEGGKATTTASYL